MSKTINNIKIDNKRFFKYINNFLLDFSYMKNKMGMDDYDDLIKQLKYILKHKELKINSIHEVIEVCLEHEKDFTKNKIYNKIMEEKKYIYGVISQYFHIENNGCGFVIITKK